MLLYVDTYTLYLKRDLLKDYLSKGGHIHLVSFAVFILLCELV